MDKLLLTIEDVCDILSVKRSKLYTLIKNDGLPTVRIGTKSLRIPSKGLREWLEGRTDGALLEERPVATDEVREQTRRV